jgi:hypothetical protein
MKHLPLLAAALLIAAPLAIARADTTFVPAQSDSEYLAKDHLIGSKVHGADGTIVADVEDLIVNDQNQVIGVVMGTGGYFGWAASALIRSSSRRRTASCSSPSPT